MKHYSRIEELLLGAGLISLRQLEMYEKDNKHSNPDVLPYRQKAELLDIAEINAVIKKCSPSLAMLWH